MQSELRGSEIDFFPKTNQKQGRRFVRCKSETGATCSAYILNESQLAFILPQAEVIAVVIVVVVLAVAVPPHQ